MQTYKYATPKPGAAVIIGKWSLRWKTEGFYILCEKSRNERYATIYATPGGCWITSSHLEKCDAFACWSMAVDDALARATKAAGKPMVLLVSAEESETLRRRAMRYSYHMPSVDVDEAVRLIFRAETDAGGQFTLTQYDALAAITDRAARQAREDRHAGA